MAYSYSGDWAMTSPMTSYAGCYGSLANHIARNSCRLDDDADACAADERLPVCVSRDQYYGPSPQQQQPGWMSVRSLLLPLDVGQTMMTPARCRQEDATGDYYLFLFIYLFIYFILFILFYFVLYFIFEKNH